MKKDKKTQIKRYTIKTKLDEKSWIDTYRKINGRKISKEIIERLHSCICNHPQVVNSILTNDHVNTRGKVIKTKNIY